MVPRGLPTPNLAPVGPMPGRRHAAPLNHIRRRRICCGLGRASPPPPQVRFPPAATPARPAAQGPSFVKQRPSAPMSGSDGAPTLSGGRLCPRQRLRGQRRLPAQGAADFEEARPFLVRAPAAPLCLHTRAGLSAWTRPERRRPRRRCILHGPPSRPPAAACPGDDMRSRSAAVDAECSHLSAPAVSGGERGGCGGRSLMPKPEPGVVRGQDSCHGSCHDPCHGAHNPGPSLPAFIGYPVQACGGNIRRRYYPCRRPWQRGPRSGPGPARESSSAGARCRQACRSPRRDASGRSLRAVRPRARPPRIASADSDASESARVPGSQALLYKARSLARTHARTRARTHARARTRTHGRRLRRLWSDRGSPLPSPQ